MTEKSDERGRSGAPTGYTAPAGETGDHEYLELKRMLRALGVASRLQIVAALAHVREISVTKLAEALAQEGNAISQPLLSWHITNLRRVGLIRTRRLGRQVFCSLDVAHYQSLLGMLSALVTPTASLAAEAAHEPHERRDQRDAYLRPNPSRA